MGCNCTKASKLRARNQRIERELAVARELQKKEVKILLLGPGESGKSTIFKQMKIIQVNGGFSQQELKDYKYIIYGNVITQMKVIVTVALKLKIELSSPENTARAKKIASIPAGGDSWTNEVAIAIRELWKDSGIRQVYALRDRKYHLNESASYFFENIDRFMKDDYVATYQDVLRARVRTTGIQEALYKFDNMSIRMLDVGGQRSERRKWIHCFDMVTAVLFIVSLSEYDQTLREGKENRMLESLALFDDICNSHWFKTTSFILFLNKTDLFKEKIARIDMKDYCFPTYTGGCNFEAGSAFVKQRFLERNLSPHMIFCHFTCAIDPEFQFMFNAVRTTIIADIIEK